MKTFILYASLTFLGIATAQEACVEGKRVTISPGYTVEYRCNKYRAGQRHNNVLSHEDCAAKCETEGLDVCTYNAARKICIVGDPSGKESTSAGATYMIRVEEEAEDPFAEEDPFAATCEEERDTLKADLDKCRVDLDVASNAPSSSSSTSCGVKKWGTGYYTSIKNMDLIGCKNACDADSKCLSYSGHKGIGVNGARCFLYDKETADVPDGPHSSTSMYVQYDKRCG